MSSRSRKKNAAPPLPPWQRLHKPVVPAPSVVDAAEQKKGAASAVKGDAKGTKAGAALPTNHPSNEPKEMKAKSDDTSTKNAPSTTTDEGNNDSTMGDMKMSPPAVATVAAGAKNNKKSTSTPSSKKSSHQNSNDSDSDDDDSDDEPTFKNFTAVKCPRTSVSAEAYAKRLREKEAAAEEEQQQKIGKSSGGGGGVASSPRRGKRDRDKAAAAQQDVMATATIVATTAKKPRLDSKKKAAVPKESAATSATRSLTRGKALPEDYLNALDNGMMESEEIPSSPQRSSRKRTKVVPYTITDAPDSSAAHGETASASTPTKKSPKKRKATKPADKKKKPKKLAKKAAVKDDDEDDDEAYVPGKDGEDDDEAYVPPTPKKKHHVTIKMEQTWKERIVMLKEHKAKYGTTDLCVADKESVNQLLRSFVFEQRKQHKKYLSGKHSSLNAERVKELEDLGFEFDPMASGTHKANAMKRFQQQWDEMYDELVQYKNVNGNCLVPLGKNADAKQKKLGNWVRGQRKLMNKEGREKFDPQRLAKLEAIDFDWNPLASGAYTANKRIELFPKVNAKWMSWYNKLVKFKEEHGNLIVGPKSKNYPGLYNWVHGQRKEYKRYQNKEENVNMYEEWIKLMHDIGFDFAPMSGEKTGFSDMLKKRSSGYFDQKWEAQYKELVKFHKKNGHCYVFRNGDNSTLAGWVHCQRKQKKLLDDGKHSQLNPKRIELLEELGFDWRPSESGGIEKLKSPERNLEWDQMFEKLKEFKEKNGHAHPKKKVPKIGNWVSSQRRLYARIQKGQKTSLTEERIAKLESIGFEWPIVNESADDDNASVYSEVEPIVEPAVEAAPIVEPAVEAAPIVEC